MRYWLALYLMIFGVGLGASYLISEIDFVADFELEHQELSQLLGHSIGREYDAETIEAALQKLKDYFADKGDYYVLVQKPELIPVDTEHLRLEFHLNRLLDTEKVYLKFKGLKYFSDTSLHRMLFTKADSGYPLRDLGLYCSRILELYQERGYLFASVEADSLVIEAGEDDQARLVAYITVQENLPFEAKKYYFRGNKTTRESSILKKSGLLGQDLINPAKLAKAEQNLKSAPYIKDCRILPLDDQSLLFELEEDRMTFLEGVLGMKRQNDKTQLSGLVNIEFQNLWGTDRGIQLFWRNTAEQLAELKLSYHDSGHPAWPVEGDFTAYRASQDSLWIQSKLGTEIYYKSLYQKIGMGIQQSSVLPGSSNSDIERDNSTRLGAFWAYQNTMGQGLPTRGFSWDAGYYYLFYGKNTNSALELGGKYYQPLIGNLISYAAVNVRAYKNPDLPEYDMYKMGGTNSLRGFSEDEFKSGSLGWMNLELRWLLDASSMLYIFYDHGILHTGKKHYQTDLFAIGGGVGLGTRLGILSVGYGLPYRDKSFSRLSLGMIHIGLDLAL